MQLHCAGVAFYFCGFFLAPKSMQRKNPKPYEKQEKEENARDGEGGGGT